MTDRTPRLLAAVVWGLAFLPSLAAAAAGSNAPHCPGPVAAMPRAAPAAFKVAALGENEVRLTFIGHATFLIESPHGVRIATDYNDAIALPIMPDIVTMNHAHATHYTNHPDPGIKVVLRGWNDDGSPAVRDLSYQDVRVRNVPTNIRDGAGGTERYGNSVFIFEVASLCIVHLGHLHHTLTSEQLAAIGPVDVVMAPVDGTYTLRLECQWQSWQQPSWLTARVEQGVTNAGKLMKEGGCHSIKLEGGAVHAELVARLVAAGIPVMGHIGLTPQSINTIGSFRAQGRDEADWGPIEEDARAVTEAGAFSVVIEAVAEPLARRITGAIAIPTIGIGGSVACDGQILVLEDMLGLSPRVPKFVRRYGDLGPAIEAAVAAYATDVRARAFPGPEQVYSMRTKRK